ncbi:MAG: carboxypeptidase regulatory-like domain-containing protein [Terriglobales bacterium]
MNSPNSVLRILIVFAGAVLFTTVAAQAQFRGSLRGTVTDSQGAVIPNATVTLENKDTGRTMVSTSDANGIYQFNALPPAPYNLTAEATGFKKKILEQVQIIPDQPNALDLKLEIGQVQQSVTVTGTTQALDTETANISGTITSNQIQHMPSFGRDVLKLAQLAPGVFGEGSQAAGTDNYNIPGTQTGGGASGGNDGIFKTENGVQVVANGNQTENNGISIDGISTTSAVWGGSTVITPSEDSVQDVKIVSNSYDAEDGRFTGAQVQITSKSGGNQVHGSLFFTTHQPNLNAYQRYNGQGQKTQRDNNKFNQFGGSVGGPIWKNKIFAFFNYETVREPNSNLSGSGWYDTPAFDALAPTGSIAAKYLSFPGNAVVNNGISPNADCQTAGLIEGVNCRTIPGEGINVGTPLTTPLGTQDLSWTSTSNPGIGNGLGTVADLALYNTSNPTTFNAQQYNGRLDADVTDRDRIAFAIYWVPLNKTNYNGNRAYDLFHHTQINDAFSLIWNHTFSPSLLNEARANAAGWRWNEITSNSQSPVGFPTDRIGQIGSITPNSFGPNVGSILNQWTYSYKDVATKIIGRHTIKFGGELTRLSYLQECAGCGVPSYNFFNIWDFLNDAPKNEGGGFNPTTGLPTTIRQDDRENLMGFFVQDDVKLRRNLTVNLGLRYSYFGPLSSKEGNMLVAVPGAGANYLTGLTIRKGNSWNPQKDNFGPQIGFAWSPGRFNDKLVIRGGYGLNYNQEEIAISSNIVNNPGLVVFPSFDTNSPTAINPGIIYATSADPHNLNAYPANPNTVSTFGSNGLPTTGSVGVQIFPGNPGTLPTMRTHHYSLDVQNDLGHQFIATLGYEGSLSRNTYFHENPNAVPAARGFALNPSIGGGDYWGVGGSANYNALLAELKHQFSYQFMADAQFQWAKSNDTSSAPYSEQDYPYNLSLNYGPSDYNVGKAFKLYALWQPVFFHENSWAEKIVGGWSLSGILNIHSGFPYTPVINVQGGNLYCGTCGYGQVLPAAYLGGAGNSTSNDAFKTAANSNFPKGGAAYFSTPTYTAYTGSNFGSALPQSPGVHRNFITGPGYRDVDMTISKSFGLPNNRILGEGAKIELRMDAYNVFNNLNFNENTISNNIAASNFSTYSSALSGRVIALTGRFSF